MSWEVEFTDEFGQWWEGLTEDEQDSIDVTVRLLEELGAASPVSPLFGHQRVSA